MPRANTKSDFDFESVRMHTEACSILIFDFKPAFCPILANIRLDSAQIFEHIYVHVIVNILKWQRNYKNFENLKFFDTI